MSNGKLKIIIMISKIFLYFYRCCKMCIDLDEGKGREGEERGVSASY